MKPYLMLLLEIAGLTAVAFTLAVLDEAHIALLIIFAWVIGKLFGRVINGWLEGME